MANGNDKKAKFIQLLNELFQLNQPELDFGLYRIMHAKSEQIKDFINTDLATQIDQAFADGGDDKVAELKAAYDQARAQAVEFGIADPDNNPKVQEAKAAYDNARDNGDDPSEIYDHLYRFFARYYDKGDFMSRRYHVAENDSRAAPYAVPYDGREIYLHWANKDQYYIKSTETLSNFSFDLREALVEEAKRQGIGLDLGIPEGESLKVQLRLVDAVEGAHNNVKENQSRFFILHAENPLELAGGTLIINFEYRPDSEKSGQEGTWQKKRLEEAEAGILADLQRKPEAKTFFDGLSSLAPTEKQKGRTLLGKYLTQYTARNTMDYFIHKDLGGFLRRELDFYIKNEVMRLDDVDESNVEGVTRSLKKIAALRKIGRQIVAFLAQLEDFQKKLWLKQKFVTETNYCITMDRVPETLYSEILANPKQQKEWRRLFSHSPPEDLGGVSPKDFLKQNPYLVLDTGLFGDEFKARLLAELDQLDEQCDGIMFHGDALSALRLVRSRLGRRVRCIYTDPPYNTGGGDFIYKDSYRHSSWASMAYDLYTRAYDLLEEEGALFSSIDDNESLRLKSILEERFGEDGHVADIVWQKRYAPDARMTISDAHEFVYLYAKDAESFKRIRNKLPLTDAQTKQFSNPDNDSRGPWKADNFTAQGYRPNQMYEIELPSGRKVTPPPGRCWVVTEDKFKTYLSDGRMYFGKNGDGQPAVKRFLRDMDGMVPWTWWPHQEVGHSQAGLKLTENILGRSERFLTAKPVELLERIIRISCDHTATVLDCFAGSGTTAHAVINLNRRDRTARKYVLAEVGGHFDAVLRARIEKVVYSRDWKDGVPRPDDAGDFGGVSHCFKYLRLESYEDAVNNLMLDGDEHRAATLDGNESRELRRDYLLHYFLNVETRGSASLLNVKEFSDPTAYSLKVKRSGGDEQVPVKVDLVETFNWLIGLDVALLDRPRTYSAEFERAPDPGLPEDQHTRLVVKGRLKEADDGTHWFRIVEGTVLRSPGNDADRDKVLVIWRKLTDDPEQDAAVLEALLTKFKINQADSEFDTIYINGPHGLSLSGQAKARLLTLEEAFMSRMWADVDGGELH